MKPANNILNGHLTKTEDDSGRHFGFLQFKEPLVAMD